MGLKSPTHNIGFKPLGVIAPQRRMGVKSPTHNIGFKPLGVIAPQIRGMKNPQYKMSILVRYLILLTYIKKDDNLRVIIF
jgi:hypothetical protein